MKSNDHVASVLIPNEWMYIYKTLEGTTVTGKEAKAFSSLLEKVDLIICSLVEEAKAGTEAPKEPVQVPVKPKSNDSSLNEKLA